MSKSPLLAVLAPPPDAGIFTLPFSTRFDGIGVEGDVAASATPLPVSAKPVITVVVSIRNVTST
jgi:hypothetical protein